MSQMIMILCLTCSVTRFFMVFACLVLSVFSTIDEYEEEASVVLLKMVR